MKTQSVRTTLAFAACMFLGAGLASAQATRTWVSGVGDDANPCSRTAPCKTFAGAISKTAAGGEISVLDPGGYGGVTITKSITISGVGENASILATGSANGILVNAGANDVVTLRDLQINGAGSGQSGIRFWAGGALVVDNVRVFGFQTGIETYTGITTVMHSVFSNNRWWGVHSLGGTLNLEGSMVTTNNVGVQATNSGTLRLSDNSIYDNLTGTGCGGGALISAGNNRTAGNAGGTAAVCTPVAAGVAIQ
jgi:hypothetical protein